MRLGGFVIHGDARDGLARCLDSLTAVCDEVVAVDSGSTDGSAELVRARGIRSVVHPWEGYGSARARAVRELEGCDHVFFLDSDEWLEAPAIEHLRRWRRDAPPAPAWLLVRRDWADLPGGRFVFSADPHVRIVRRDRATWTPRMIVHEALSRAGARRLDAVIEHRFTTSLEAFRAKEERYALLWAIQAHAEGRRPKHPALQLVAHTVRFGLLKGAALRGGSAGLALAHGMARYHARKHERLAELRAGAHAELVQAYADGRLGELFRAVAASPARAR